MIASAMSRMNIRFWLFWREKVRGQNSLSRARPAARLGCVSAIALQPGFLSGKESRLFWGGGPAGFLLRVGAACSRFSSPSSARSMRQGAWLGRNSSWSPAEEAGQSRCCCCCGAVCGMAGGCCCGRRFHWGRGGAFMREGSP